MSLARRLTPNASLVRQLASSRCWAPSRAISYKVLDEREVQDSLAKLQSWSMDQTGKSISREFNFKGFSTAWAFCTQIAMQAHVKNHHPKIENEHKRVKITLSTHDRDALTDADFKLASSFDRIAAKYLQ